MGGLLTWIDGNVYVELSGSSPERVINLCGYNGIQLWNMTREEERYRFYVHRHDLEPLVAYVRKTNNVLIVLEQNGLPYGLRRHKKRGWFVMGIVLCLMLLYVSSLRIWQISFEGNSYFTEERLYKTLYQEGYHIGMSKGDIVCDDLEMKLRERYPEITWVSAQISGTCLSVHIRENTGILTVESKETIPCDLVASQDGIITDIITRSGTPLVKAGETVTEGQILVRGAVELYNDSKEKTGEHLVRADADILAQTQIVYNDRFSVEYPMKWYTGQERYCLTVEVFDHRLCVDLTQLSLPFVEAIEMYDTVTTYGQFPEEIRWLIPVTWQLSIRREYEETTGIYSQQQVKQLTEENCLYFFENLLEKGVQIIEKNVRIDTMGNECVVEAVVTVLQDIGHPVPLSDNIQDQEDITN